MDKADLVRVHKARIAHHVAAVCQIDRQNRSAAVLDRRRAVVVQLFVVVRFHIAAREKRFDMLEKLRVDRHHVFDLAVLRTIFDHPHLAVTFDDLRLDLADIVIDECRYITLARQDLLAGLDHALRTERIGRTRKAKRRLGLLP